MKKRYLFLVLFLALALSINVSVCQGDTVLFSDDFSGDLSAWEVILGEAFAIKNGVLEHTGGETRMLVIGVTVTDVAVEVDIRWNVQAAFDAGVIVRWQNATNFYFFGGYPGFGIWRHVQGNWINIVSAGKPQFKGGWYRVRAEAIGNELRLYVNGTLLAEATDNTFPSSGRVGVRVYPNPAEVSYDNYVVIETDTHMTSDPLAFYMYTISLQGQEITRLNLEIPKQTSRAVVWGTVWGAVPGIILGIYVGSKWAKRQPAKK